MQTKTHRRELIEDLLWHLTDYEPGARVVSAEGGGTGETPRMPALYWQDEVQELYRTLELLRGEPEVPLENDRTATGRTTHAHLTAYYRSEHRIVRPYARRRVIRGVVHTVEPAPSTWRREPIVSPWIIMPLVKAGTAFVDEHYRLTPLPVRVIVERMETFARKRANAA